MILLNFATYIDNQKVSIELDRIISGQTEFTINVGDLIVSDSLKDEHGSCISQAKLLIDKMIKAEFDKHYSGLRYVYDFLEIYERLRINYDN